MPREPDTATEPLDGALVRLPLSGDRWAEDLPPVPDGFDVSASFSSADDADVHGEALARLGYRVVGVCRTRDGGEPCADVLVPGALIAARPRFWRALRDRADRAFGLGFGPVAVLLADVLAAHERRPT